MANLAETGAGVLRRVSMHASATPSLSVFRFGFGAPGVGADACLPVLAGDAAETLFAGALPAGRTGSFALYEAGDWLVGASRIEPGEQLEARAGELYRELLDGLRARGRHAARIWNYVPAINADGPGGLENYRAFCLGRARTFEESGAGEPPPAASAVGADDDGLAVLFAATVARPRVIENPEQVPAYEYPSEHGPRAPSFSRAAQVEANGRRWTFVSGTAAIKGHATIAPGSLAGQIDCTLDNLRIMSGACRLGEGLGASGAGRHFKVYLRHAADLDPVRAALAARLLRPGDRVSWLRSDICRAALRLEIEATVVE